MPRSFGSIVTARAQKWDSKSGHRQIEGRPANQNPGVDRCFGKLGLFRAAAWTALRYHWIRASYQGRRVRRLVLRNGLAGGGARNKELYGAPLTHSSWVNSLGAWYKLKEFKRIATRSDKTDTSFGAMIYLASAVIASR